MGYPLQIGLRYMGSKKGSTISMITWVAILGVALGVGALLTVLAITTGFQEEFRHKILGVNAHVMISKYGRDFSEYREVVDKALAKPEVRGAGPFVIHDMMLVKADRVAGVTVKGVDPVRLPTVLDMPRYLKQGSISGLRLEGARPPLSPAELSAPVHGAADDLDHFLQELENNPSGASPPSPSDVEVNHAVEAARHEDPPALAPAQALPSVEVLTPEQMEAALSGSEQVGLPSIEEEEAVLAEEARAAEPEARERKKLPGIIVGFELADNLGLKLGDEVRLISPEAGLDTSAWGSSSGPKQRDFEVIGIFKAGFQEYDIKLVYVDLYEAQAVAGLGDTVFGVEMTLHDAYDAPALARAFESELGGPYRASDWHEVNENIFTALEIQKIILTLLIATIVFVAAFNVIATLIMVVIEKKREVAILKAMGATDAAILKIFTVQGFIIGVVGTVLGLIMGGAVVSYLVKHEFPLDPKVYVIDHLPVRSSVFEFAVAAAVSLVICTIATLAPSWWAARMMPADGVRYE